MKNLLASPVRLFLFTGLLTMAVAIVVEIFSDETSVIDIQLHDTYFLTAHAHIYIALGLIFLLFSLVHHMLQLLFRHHLNLMLSRLHSWLTILWIPLLALFLLFGINESNKASLTATHDVVNSMETYQNITYIFIGMVVFFLLIQLLLPANIAVAVVSLLRGKKNNS